MAPSKEVSAGFFDLCLSRKPEEVKAFQELCRWVMHSPPGLAGAPHPFPEVHIALDGQGKAWGLC